MSASATTADRRPVRELPFDYVQTESKRPRAKGRELTTLNIVLLLVTSAIVIVAYIANTITVDTLMRRITVRDRELQQLTQRREALRAEINHLSSYTRIQAIATGELGLVYARQQPFTLAVPGLPAETHDGE